MVPDPSHASPIDCLFLAIGQLSGPCPTPSPLAVSRHLHLYGALTPTHPSNYSQTTIELMAVENTPFLSCIDGLPWHCISSSLALHHWQAAEDVNPPCL